MASTKLMQEIEKVLQQFEGKYFVGDKMNKARVIEDIDNYDVDLMSAMLDNEGIKNNFATKIDDHIIFKTNQFIEVFQADEYWEDSYTKYSKKIGLTSNGNFLDEANETVLDFPYKDTVLKASMSKEDTDKEDLRPDEPFLNEVIAREEIDVLLDKKILENAKKYSSDGEEETSEFFNEDNLIVKGNNLLALHSLQERFEGKIDFIYIDPPYNTKNDSFIYNDNFNVSTWLTFMKNRLEIARSLLSDTGSIFISIDGNQFDYLSLLLKEIFGKNNLLEVFHFQVRYANKSLNDRDDFQPIIEYGFAYAKDKTLFKPNKPTIPYDTSKFKFEIIEKKDPDRTFKLDDGRKVEVFQKGSYSINKIGVEKTKNLDYFKETWITGSIYSDTGHGTMYKRAVEPFREIDGNESLYKIDGLGEDGLGFRYMTNPKSDTGNYGKMFTKIPISKKDKILKGEYERERPIINFYDISASVGNIRHEGGVTLNKGKKPEKMLGNLIDIFTNPNDRVLDFFLGSGTTAAVAHKKNRKYIGIEQMDYIDEKVMTRLQNVIDGDQTGISEDVDWQGGGSFVYAELMEKNRGYLTDVMKAPDQGSLRQVFNLMLENADFDFRVDLEEVEDSLNTLSLEDQKRVLVKILDKNQLYYNYSEIDDENVRDLISDNDYEFNQNFYKEDNDE